MEVHPNSPEIPISHRTRRLARESIQAKKAVEGDIVTVYIIDAISSDHAQWRVTITPPQTSLYHGGRFKLILDFPLDYPFKPPRIQFETKIFHPNIDIDSGFMHLAIFGPQWCPAYTGDSLLRTIIADLDQPVLTMWKVDGVNPEGETTWCEESYAANGEAAELWTHDREAYETRVAEWLVMYAVADELADDDYVFV